MPYGVSSTMWAQMSPEDQNQVIAEYNKANGVGYTPPSIGGYVQPTSAQVSNTLAQSGLDQATQTSVQQAYQGSSSAVTPTAQKPQFVFAVNMATTYPPYEDMKANGQTLVVVADDPNAQMLIDGARQHGVRVAVQVNAPPGITPEQYAARVADAKQKWNPEQFVLDIEDPGKGTPGSTGWSWSDQAAPLLQQATGGTKMSVTMPPLQDDYNYKAYANIGANFWVQSYLGDMTPIDPNVAVNRLIANGVDPAKIVPIVGPNSSVNNSSFATWGIPGATTTTGPGGGPGTVTDVPALPSTGSSSGSGTGTGSGSGTGTGSGTDTSTENWAAAYFASFGLPSDVASKVNEIFTKHPGDTDTAIQIALAYVRGTPWYAQTFPGIQYGMQHGIITNENDYRQYVTAIDTLAQRYLGRHISGGEISSYMFEGVTPDIVGKQYEGQATLETNVNDYQYYLGGFSDQKNLDTDAYRALANESAGLDSPMGQKLTKALQQAMQKYQSLFQGNAATPSLSLGKSGLSAPSLLGGHTTPDVGA